MCNVYLHKIHIYLFIFVFLLKIKSKKEGKSLHLNPEATFDFETIGLLLR